MEIDEIRELFEKHDEEFLKFEKVENKLSNKRDLHAFMLLDQLSKDKSGDIIGHAEHDEYLLNFDEEEIENLDLTENIIIDLRRCGVLFDEEFEVFKLFA